MSTPTTKNKPAGSTPAASLDVPAIALDDAERFLRALGGRMTFQTFDDNKERKAANIAAARDAGAKPVDPFARVMHGTLSRNASRLSGLNAQGVGVFVMVNEGDGNGRRADNVQRVRAYFVDFDGTTPPPTTAVPLPPHCIVESSSGRWHWYWWLKDAPPEMFKGVQVALAERFHSDTSVNDLPRVMRLPGFLHCKNAPFRTRIAELRDETRYTHAQFVDAFELNTRTVVPRVRDPNAPEAVEGMARELAQKWGRKRATEYLRDEAPPAVEGEHGDRGTVDVAMRVHDFGMTESECLALMLDENGWNSRCIPPWSPCELAVKIASAYKSALSPRGCDNLCAIFDPVEQPAEARAVAITGGDEVAWRRPMFAVDLSNFQRAIVDPPRFMVDRIVPAGFVTLLGGHGGAGKSILALSIAAHFAAGAPAYGLPVEGGPALYVSLEDPGELMRYRLRRVVDAFGLDAKAVTENLRIADGTAAGALMREDGRWTASLSETAAMREMRAMIGDASVIFIDNASDALDGNENARGQVRTFLRTLANLGRDDTAVVLIAHIDKAAARYGASGNSYSGSSAWHNSARSRLALTPGKNGAVELRHEKSNLGPRIPTMRLEWTAGGVLVPAATGSASNDEDAAAVLAAIEAATRDGVSIPTARTGGYTAQAALSTLPELPDRLKGAPGREAFWAGIAALQRSGRIVAEEYTTSARHKRERFTLAPAAT